jgi:hypothetical protein
MAIEAFQAFGGLVRPGYVASRIPIDSGLRMPTLNRFSDYDNDNDNDNDIPFLVFRFSSHSFERPCIQNQAPAIPHPPRARLSSIW